MALVAKSDRSGRFGEVHPGPDQRPGPFDAALDVEAMRRTHPEKMDILPDWQQVMDYILHTDQHRPFVSGVAEPLLADLRPDWLVHEFIPASYADWETKVSCQRHSLQWE